MEIISHLTIFLLIDSLHAGTRELALLPHRHEGRTEPESKGWADEEAARI